MDWFHKADAPPAPWCPVSGGKLSACGWNILRTLLSLTRDQAEYPQYIIWFTKKEESTSLDSEDFCAKFRFGLDGHNNNQPKCWHCQEVKIGVQIDAKIFRQKPIKFSNLKLRHYPIYSNLLLTFCFFFSHASNHSIMFDSFCVWQWVEQPRWDLQVSTFSNKMCKYHLC